jgi:hypothetical protein
MYSVDRYALLEYIAAWFYILSVFEVDEMTAAAVQGVLKVSFVSIFLVVSNIRQSL